MNNSFASTFTVLQRHLFQSSASIGLLVQMQIQLFSPRFCEQSVTSGLICTTNERRPVITVL